MTEFLGAPVEVPRERVQGDWERRGKGKPWSVDATENRRYVVSMSLRIIRPVLFLATIGVAGVTACGSTSPTTSPGDGDASSSSSGGSSGGGSGGSGGGGSDASGVEAGNVLDAAPPAIDPSTLLNNLDDSQKAEMCDWMTAALGGYGTAFNCAGGVSVSNPANQAQCIATWPKYRCNVNVGQLETCVLAEAPSHGCDIPEPQCTPISCG
jgi:hypothetical protein